EIGDGVLDFAGLAQLDRAYLHAQQRGDGLDRAQLCDPGSKGAIEQDRRSRHLRRNLFEQLKPFCALTKLVERGKTVTVPPRRDRLATKPWPTGSAAFANTMGTVRVVCRNALTSGLPLATKTSGVSASSSAAYLRMRSASPAPQRASIRRFVPTVHPNCCRPCANAMRRACPSESSAVKGSSTPTRRMRSGCCARAASGNAAAPPSS